MCGNLASIGIDARKLIIRIDRSKGKQNLIDDFNKYIEMKFKEVKWNRELDVFHSWSHSWSGLQIADVVSWAVFSKYEYDNDYYFRIIEKKINVVHIWQ